MSRDYLRRGHKIRLATRSDAPFPPMASRCFPPRGDHLLARSVAFRLNLHLLHLVRLLYSRCMFDARRRGPCAKVSENVRRTQKRTFATLPGNGTVSLSLSQAADSPAAWQAGAATVDITPCGPVFLFGYPHVPRMSTGVHDSLECAALYLRCGDDQVLFLANDVIFVAKSHTAEIRRRIRERTDVPEEAIMITATHTHSGPLMLDYLSNAADPAVPKTDPAYLAFFTERVVIAAEIAVRSAAPAELGFALARADGVGTNRHDPAGPSDLDVPVLVARALASQAPIACMLVCAMHPTVLHEDSTVISADFPFFTREYIRQHALSASCPVLFHQGASGNQSPRHVTRANTLPEARRLGEILGQNIVGVLAKAAFHRDGGMHVRGAALHIASRQFPNRDAAAEQLAAARQRFASLKAGVSTRQSVRTAECDVFGA